ncbi:hypothetical protein XELAEV_18007992mg [Xenopus laevis]|uniref:Coiled-coil domain-containing protein 112 n=1 Tax=Xenopus laevis TaxID=8355 RepID=A0A974I5L0_XENLA|nr:hypothetical protein XELAEV_18007992mg [Xenopus laevis]
MAALATGLCETECEESAVQNESSFSHVGGERNFPTQTWKIKADQAKKAEYFRELEKYKGQIANLEKDKNGNLYSKKNDFRAEYSALEEYEQKLACSRRTEKLKTEQQLSKIHNHVKRLQRQLKDVKPTPEFVEKLRVMMEEVDNAICTFKEEQRVTYEELLKEEKTTSNELNVLEKKIEASLSTAPEKTFRAPSGKTPAEKMTSRQLPEEVVEFERFLQQTGGRLGGWDEFDHQSFLKVWTKHKGKAAYLEEALAYLPSRTREDVQQHETWYQEFLFLEEKKKELRRFNFRSRPKFPCEATSAVRGDCCPEEEAISHQTTKSPRICPCAKALKAIHAWKTKKQLEKEISKLQIKTKEVKEFNQQKQEESQKQKTEEEKRKKQQELEAWKRQKEIDAAAQIQTRLEEEEEQLKKQRKERQRQLEVKLLVEEHTRFRKEKEEFLWLEKQMREEAEQEERRRMAVFEICRFQDRDLKKLEEKAQERRAKEKSEAEKERRLAKLKEKVQVHVERDPSRLCKLTKGWEERCKEIGPSGSAPLQHIPHRHSLLMRFAPLGASSEEVNGRGPGTNLDILLAFLTNQDFFGEKTRIELSRIRFEFFRIDKGHSFEDSKVQILDKEDRWFERDVKEAIHVKVEKPSLNRGGGLRHHLSATYNAVLTSVPWRIQNTSHIHSCNSHN